MAQTFQAPPATPAPRSVRAAKQPAVARPPPPLGPTRVLQNRAAPAQLSLFGRARPAR